MASPIQTPHLVRLGWFNGNFEESLRLFSEDFILTPNLTRLPLKRYLYFQEMHPNYLIYATHEPTRQYSPEKHNLSLVIASDDHALNSRVLAEFEAKTKISQLCNPPSPKIGYLLGQIADILPILRKAGREHVKALFTHINHAGR